jgi:hypothetical protein
MPKLDQDQEAAANIAIMASLLLVRLGFSLFNPTGLSGDAFGYVKAAQTVIDTGKLPALEVQPRGYSLLIAPLLASGLEIDRVVLVMNALLDCSVVAVLLLTAKSILPEPGDRNPRLLCWLLATIQPFTAEMVNSVLTETPTMFLVFIGVWLLFLASSFIARVVGFTLLGAASLLRIDILFLSLVASISYVVLFVRKAVDIRASLLGLALICAFPISMLVYQYHSTQEIGLVSLVKHGLWHPGYYTWMRSWLAIEKIEFDRFAWDVGTANWAGFDVANFPSRAFDSTAERDRVAELMTTWRNSAYTDSVDRGFQQLGIEKFKQHPLRSFVLVPLLRMIHYWINIDGAQTYLRVLPIRRPLSTLVVAFTVSLRLVIILLAAIGAYAVWLRPRTLVNEQVRLARFASLLVLMRTAELGILGTVAFAGLMEVRYILVVFPFVLLLSFWGVRYLFGMRPVSKALNKVERGMTIAQQD